MKRKLLYLFLYVLPVFLVFKGCSENPSGVQVEPTDEQAVLWAIESDSLFISFEKNYIEENDAALVLPKISGIIYPERIGKQIDSVKRFFTTNIASDTANTLGTLIIYGKLLIHASFDSTVPAGIIVQKPFTSVITRKIISVRTTPGMKRWKVVAYNLPSGGELTENISIQKLSLVVEGNESFVINDPADFFISTTLPRFRQVPVLERNKEVDLQVEILSKYEGNDLILLNFGADYRGMNRLKKIFELISSVPDGNYYRKVYKVSFSTRTFPGYYHAVIQAISNGTINTDVIPVEYKVWSIPYAVKF